MYLSGPFLIDHRVCESNAAGADNDTETASTSGPPEITPVFREVDAA